MIYFSISRFFVIYFIVVTTLFFVGMSNSARAETVQAVTQIKYDEQQRPLCVAIRMNPSIWSSQVDACVPQTTGSNGPDRITKKIYDAANNVQKTQKAVGTNLQQDYETFTYSSDGKQTSLIDANGNKSIYGYDGFDRLIYLGFPSITTPGSASSTDYEQYNYDNNGNRTWFRKRDGRGISYFYDALNRMTSKTLAAGGACVSGYACTNPPSSAVRNVYFGYDLRGLQLYARFDSATGEGVSNTYDGLGRVTSTVTTMGGTSLALNYQYDLDNNRTRITHPDGTVFGYDYDGLDRQSYLRDGAGNQLELLLYYANGEQQWIGQNANGTGFGYDPILRLSSYGWQRYDPASNTVTQVNTGLAYNPVSQVVQQSRGSSAYAFPGYVNISRTYASNGLNQYTSAGPASFTYDANGNVTSDGTTTYIYDVENRLISTSAGASLTYDPLGRLYKATGNTTDTRFLYDGDALVGEYDASGTLLRRYVHLNGEDRPMLWYEGTNTSPYRYYVDHLGSVTQVIDDSGTIKAIDSYDEYGIPAAGNNAASLKQRFQYTGQAWLPELGMYYYKARIYSPTMGRFLQTDPIGYKDQNNLYVYVANDPVNNEDPSGEETACGNNPCPTLKGGNPTAAGVAQAINKAIRTENSTSKVNVKGATVTVQTALKPQVTVNIKIPVVGSVTVKGTLAPSTTKEAVTIKGVQVTATVGKVVAAPSQVTVYQNGSNVNYHMNGPLKIEKDLGIASINLVDKPAGDYRVQ